jgi:methylmalonyl-CoA/ethylmalonyl-CoA epimerase
MPGFLRSLSGAWNGEIYEDPDHGVRVAFVITHSGDAAVELVQPRPGGSPIDRFLHERGGGLHHACYETENLEERLAEMRGKGASIVRRPKAAVAFQGRRVAWVLTPERFLIELLETAAKT